MHRNLEELLATARGESKFVAAVFLDIRGFSSFAKMAESSEAAVFLRRMYLEILRDFYPSHDFFKPTGDGLMIIREFESESLVDVLNAVIEQSLRLVDTFPQFCLDDPMINFDVPQKLGVGVARGAVTKLVSGESTLDYSGRPLNLAARLMDLARPAGVVFDEGLGAHLLSEELQAQFVQESVYVKGLAESRPMTIFRSKAHTIVPAHVKRPLHKAEWVVAATEELKLKELMNRHRFTYDLDEEPAGPVELVVEWPMVMPGGKPSDSLLSEQIFTMTRDDAAGSPRAEINFDPIVKYVREQGVKLSWPLTLTVRHPVGSGF